MIVGYIMGIPIDDLVYRIPNKKENKDSQLEIDFEKANAEAKQDEILSKMTKKELIERCKYLQKVNIEISEKEKNIATNYKQFKIEADEKINKLIAERNDLLIKLNKANDYIEWLKSIIENIKFVMKRDFNIIINV